MRVKIDNLWKDCKIHSTYRIVDLSSMSRIERHAKNGMVGISALRGGLPLDKKYEDFTPKEKEAYKIAVERTESLEKDIRNLGYGFIKTIGGYIEQAEKPGEEDVDVNEFSFIVPYKPGNLDEVEFVVEMAHLANQYDQQSILVAGFDWIADGQVRYIKTDEAVNFINNKEDILKKIDPTMEFTKTEYHQEVDKKNRPYYTKIRKLGERNFTFDSESKKNLSKIVGVHKPIGMGAVWSANKKGEIYNL